MKPASGWRSSEFFASFGTTGGVLYLASEMIGRGQFWPAAAMVAASVVLPAVYTKSRISLKANAMSQTDPTANIDPIDLIAESIITKTAAALAPQLAKALIAQGIDPALAQVKAENIATAASGLVVDLIDVATDIKVAKQIKRLAAAQAVVAAAKAK